MNDLLKQSITKVCAALNKHSVEYLTVGGVAVAFHGYDRHTVDDDGHLSNIPDIDIWFNTTYTNYYKLLSALKDLGQDIKRFEEEQTPNPQKSYFKYRFDSFELDIIPKLKAELDFKTAYTSKETITVNNIEVPYISYENLVADKKINPRPKDLDDIQQLRLINDIKTKGAICLTIDDILWHDWDPLGINDIAPRDEYRSYIPEICELAMSGASKEEIANHLLSILTNKMGGAGSVDRCNAVAEKIIKACKKEAD
ncbi:MAG: hypothetical protein R2800_08235 [Flavipsychrobacter sp.]